MGAGDWYNAGETSRRCHIMTNPHTPADANSNGPDYGPIFLAFMRNSLSRDMTFRANFLIDCVSSLTWTAMNIGFYLLIFQYTKQIGRDSGWGQYEFFIFLATGMIINSVVQAFFMPNCEELSELIRTGGLDFALLKPIDAQFLLSLQKIEWSALSNVVAALVLIVYGVLNLLHRSGQPLAIDWFTVPLYLLYVACGIAILYSLMIALSATSIWLGRNQSLYDFWFYITNFSRYPMEIYDGPYGRPLRLAFTFVIPVLVVVNVPAQILAQPIVSAEAAVRLPLAVFTLFATVFSLLASRWLFQKALEQYRSASS